MIYLLDTNICIYIMKQQPEKVAKKFNSLHPGDVAISSISLSELTYGANKSQYIQRNILNLKKFIHPIQILQYDTQAAFHYGEIRAYLEKNGIPIGALDMLIAAHAMSINATLVTNNTKEFLRVKNLKVVNWA